MITPTVPTPAVTGQTRIAPVPAERRPSARTVRGRSRFVSSDTAWAAAMSAILILIAGALTLATSQPWLFAALGPSVVVIVSAPGQPSARFHSVVVGHLSALLCGWLVVVLVGATGGGGGGLTDGGVGIARVWGVQWQWQ